jgi:hypothetical protein
MNERSMAGVCTDSGLEKVYLALLESSVHQHVTIVWLSIETKVCEMQHMCVCIVIENRM